MRSRRGRNDEHIHKFVTFDRNSTSEKLRCAKKKVDLSQVTPCMSIGCRECMKIQLE